MSSNESELTPIKILLPNKQDKEIQQQLSNDMRFIGICLNVVGLMLVLGGISEWLKPKYFLGSTDILIGLLTFFGANSTKTAATFFRAGTEPEVEEDDYLSRKNLIRGFRKIEKIYWIQLWAIAVSLIQSLFLQGGAKFLIDLVKKIQQAGIF